MRSVCEFYLPTLAKVVPDGPDWIHEINMMDTACRCVSGQHPHGRDGAVAMRSVHPVS